MVELQQGGPSKGRLLELAGSTDKEKEKQAAKKDAAPKKGVRRLPSVSDRSG